MPQSTNPRNVQIYSSTQQTPQLVAGFLQLGRTTVFELYACLEICFQQPQPGQFRLSDAAGVVLNRETPEHIVPINNYFVVSLSNIPFIVILNSSGSRRIC